MFNAFARTLLIGTSLLSLAVPAVAQSPTGTVTVNEPWVRLNAPGTKVTGAFMVLRNSTDKEIRLTRAASPVAGITELHSHVQENGVMKMRQVPSIVIPAKGETHLKPGSYHVMLIDLKTSLQEGATAPITLGFEDGSTLKVEAKVIKPAAEKHSH